MKIQPGAKCSWLNNLKIWWGKPGSDFVYCGLYLCAKFQVDRTIEQLTGPIPVSVPVGGDASARLITSAVLSRAGKT